MAQAVEPEQLRWLLKQGFAVWMFDGLDEFYADEKNDFLPFLEAELADPDSQAQILICARDSLLSSSERVRGFIERQLARGGAVEIYELAPWGADAWAEIAWLELRTVATGRRLPARSGSSCPRSGPLPPWPISPGCRSTAR